LIHSPSITNENGTWSFEQACEWNKPNWDGHTSLWMRKPLVHSGQTHVWVHKWRSVFLPVTNCISFSDCFLSIHSMYTFWILLRWRGLVWTYICCFFRAYHVSLGAKQSVPSQELPWPGCRHLLCIDSIAPELLALNRIFGFSPHVVGGLHQDGPQATW